MSERRYKENEVREIFGLATRRPTAEPPRRTEPAGLTLADMQDIGRQVGLEPDTVARAAATYDARAVTLPRRTSFGMPISVGRTVPLPRALTDAEWEQLVAELRATFGARGRDLSEGSLREWANGNLHASVEPSETGHRLRLGTLKGDARGINALGVTGLLSAALTAGALAVSGGLPDAVFVPLLFGWGGIAAFAANLVRLPRWAKQREQQMEHIAARVTGIVKQRPAPEVGSGNEQP